MSRDVVDGAGEFDDADEEGESSSITEMRGIVGADFAELLRLSAA